jgi:hypothetical protein
MLDTFLAVMSSSIIPLSFVLSWPLMFVIIFLPLLGVYSQKNLL